METNPEEYLECLLSVDEMLSEIEEALQGKHYDTAMHKLLEAKAMIEEVRLDDEAHDDRQEVETHMMRAIK